MTETMRGMQTPGNIQFESDWADSKLRNCEMMWIYLLGNDTLYYEKNGRGKGGCFGSTVEPAVSKVVHGTTDDKRSLVQDWQSYVTQFDGTTLFHRKHVKDGINDTTKQHKTIVVFTTVVAITASGLCQPRQTTNVGVFLQQCSKQQQRRNLKTAREQNQVSTNHKQS